MKKKDRKKEVVFSVSEEGVDDIDNFQRVFFHPIPSNVGVFIAFGIGGHGVAGNGHSHLNQIVS